MRATMRITWLLLSLSFLLHHVCSADSTTSVTKNATTAMPVPSAVPTNGSPSGTVVVKAITTVGGTTRAPSTAAPTTSDASTKKQLTTPAVTTPAIATTATTKTVNNPTTTKPPATTVTNKPAALSTTIYSGSPTVRNATTPAAAAAATSSPPKTPIPATTPGSTTGSVTVPKVVTTQPPAASVPSQTTQALVSVPGNVGTTKIPPYTPTTGKQSPTHTTIATKTSPHSKGGTAGTTVAVTGNNQTASKTPAQAGNTGTTISPSTLTMAGHPAAKTSSTKAGAASLQTTTTSTTTTAPKQPKIFSYSLNNGHEKEDEKELVAVCRRLMVNFEDGNCTLTFERHDGKIKFGSVETNGKMKTSLAAQYYEEITKKPTDNKTLIAILASCGALLIMIVILAVCASHHRRPYNENQQHLTEELHTVENGYHDNPTLEVMEVQPEMQEKKMALNGEFNDSWIVPIDNLLKEDIADEEDTHL